MLTVDLGAQEVPKESMGRPEGWPAQPERKVSRPAKTTHAAIEIAAWRWT